MHSVCQQIDWSYMDMTDILIIIFLTFVEEDKLTEMEWKWIERWEAGNEGIYTYLYIYPYIHTYILYYLIYFFLGMIRLHIIFYTLSLCRPSASSTFRCVDLKETICWSRHLFFLVIIIRVSLSWQSVPSCVLSVKVNPDVSFQHGFYLWCRTFRPFVEFFLARSSAFFSLTDQPWKLKVEICKNIY